MEKKVDITNFIGVYDGYIPEIVCKEMIDFYEQKNNLNLAFSRIQTENAGTLLKKDSTVFLHEKNLQEWFDSFKLLFVNLDIAIKNYISYTNLKSLYDNKDLLYTSFRLQKTYPGGGYHIWHIEHASIELRRVLSFAIYLNDIQEGGETEFLHQSVRVTPKKGRIVIWPAGFPYVHRGNPPLKENKYILTSWILCCEN